jgi:hypothetical protein
MVDYGFFPLPTEFPSSGAWQLVSDAIRNKEVDLYEAAHGALHVAAWGLRQVHEHPDPPRGGDTDLPPAEMTRAAVADACEVVAKGGRGAFPSWLLPLMPIILDVGKDLFKKLLEKLLK